MKNPTQAQVQAAVQMKMDGLSFKQILKETDLNYSQVWLPWFRQTNPDLIIDPEDPKFKEKLARARGFVRRPAAEGVGFKRKPELQQQSWGELSALTGLPESRIRKVFAEYTQVDSEGLRMGKGGRWLDDDPTFYRGDRPDDFSRTKAGTDFVKGKAGREEAPTMRPTTKTEAKQAPKRKPTNAQDKINKLRAKAASTTFPAEAAALTAKADAMQAKLDGKRTAAA